MFGNASSTLHTFLGDYGFCAIIKIVRHSPEAKLSVVIYNFRLNRPGTEPVNNRIELVVDDRVWPFFDEKKKKNHRVELYDAQGSEVPLLNCSQFLRPFPKPETVFWFQRPVPGLDVFVSLHSLIYSSGVLLCDYVISTTKPRRRDLNTA